MRGENLPLPGPPGLKPHDKLGPPPGPGNTMSAYVARPSQLIRQDGGSSPDDNEYAYVDDYRIDSMRACPTGTGTGEAQSGYYPQSVLTFGDAGSRDLEHLSLDTDLVSMDGTMYKCRPSDGRGLAGSGNNNPVRQGYKFLSQGSHTPDSLHSA